MGRISSNHCSFTECANNLQAHRCSRCNQRFCRNHLLQHGGSCGRNATATLLTFALSFMFFGILFYFFYHKASTAATHKVIPTNVLGDNTNVKPTSHQSAERCPGSHVAFEHSNLLTDDHQNDLNSFYKDAICSVAKWKLIYRLVIFIFRA